MSDVHACVSECMWFVEWWVRLSHLQARPMEIILQLVLLTFNHISVLFKCTWRGWNTELTGSEEASTCQVLSKDKSGPLIHSLALASISLHLSAVKDTKAEGKGGHHSRLFLSVSDVVRLDLWFTLVRVPPPDSRFLRWFPLACQTCPFLSLSASFSQYDYRKLYGDSARVQQTAAAAIGWLALHPHL